MHSDPSQATPKRADLRQIATKNAFWLLTGVILSPPAGVMPGCQKHVKMHAFCPTRLKKHVKMHTFCYPGPKGGPLQASKNTQNASQHTCFIDKNAFHGQKQCVFEGPGQHLPSLRIETRTHSTSGRAQNGRPPDTATSRFI